MRLLVPAVPAIAMLMALASCSSSEGGATLPPVTGIVIPAESITRSRGCGTEPGRVYKYAAIVNAAGSGDGGTGGRRGLARGVYDCFVNATFTELPRNNDGSAPYVLDVVALDFAQYEAQRAVLDSVANQAATLDLLAFDKLSGVVFACDATFRVDVTTTAACRNIGTR